MYLHEFFTSSYSDVVSKFSLYSCIERMSVVIFNQARYQDNIVWFKLIPCV